MGFVSDEYRLLKSFLERQDKFLEKIERYLNPFYKPSASKDVTSPPTLQFLDTNVSTSNEEFITSRKFVTLLGVIGGSGNVLKQDIPSETGGTIVAAVSNVILRIGSTANPPIALRLNQSVQLPGIDTAIYITIVPSDVSPAQKWCFAFSDDSFSLKEDRLPPFRINEDNSSTYTLGGKWAVMRAAIDRRGDQYVLFRSNPTVVISGTVTVTGTVTNNAAAAVAGGYTPYFNSALSTTVQSVKSSAGKLGGWYIYNPNAAVAFVQIFNVASGSVTLGTTTPTLSLGIPATSAANLMNGEGADFATAISIAATTTATGLTAPGTALPVNFLYK